MTLNDLVAHQWSVIAVCVCRRSGEKAQMEWIWDLSEHDQSVLEMARAGGHILTAQRRGDDGDMRLVAKLRRVNGRSS